MKFFPSRDFYIVTWLPIEESRKRLQEEVQPWKFRIRLGEELLEPESFFIGVLENDTFHMKQRDRRGRYTNNPRVTGTLEVHDSGCRLHIIMKEPRIRRLAPVVWFLYIAMMLFFTLGRPFSSATVFSIFIGFAFPTGFYLYFKHSFNIEADDITAFLTRLVEGKIETPTM